MEDCRAQIAELALQVSDFPKRFSQVLQQQSDQQEMRFDRLEELLQTMQESLKNDQLERDLAAEQDQLMLLNALEQ